MHEENEKTQAEKRGGSAGQKRLSVGVARHRCFKAARRQLFRAVSFARLKVDAMRDADK
jgi:hypothetical protein